MARQSFNLGSKPPEIEVNKPDPQVSWRNNPYISLLLYLVIFSVVWMTWNSNGRQQSEPLAYSEFKTYLDQGRVKNVVIGDETISGTLTIKDDKTGRLRQFSTVPLADHELAAQLAEHGVDYSVHHQPQWLRSLLGWLLPLALLLFFWSFMLRRMSGAAGGFLNIGNKVRIHADSLPPVTFDDVAGVEEAKEELMECIEFLRNPESIQRLGGHMPKGLLVLGAPGTGKTLLARAVAGEAGVPFFNISGAEFIEMFVGVGAARVRDLFQQAREKAPCIIFIDELDAIGRSRGGVSPMSGHDEREQTLNQLLTEMDGFDPSIGVVVMAATNRPEILDPALLRAGRFDRQIVVDKPDLAAREKILALHARKLTLAEGLDLTVVAQRTPGFVGADLANIANEAAILAVRHHRESVTMEDFEAAIDRVIAGPEKKHRVLGLEEKRRIAYHEAGHALVAVQVPTGEPVHKVSIIPRGGAALGFTLQLPVTEKFLSTSGELEDQLAILLGGRVAEEIIYNDASTGAANDLERASDIAREMVTRLGMSAELGPVTYGRRQQLQFLGGDFTEDRNYSEATAQQIDQAVRLLVEEAHDRATAILDGLRPALEMLATVLQEKEVIGGEEVKSLVAAAGIEPEKKAE